MRIFLIIGISLLMTIALKAQFNQDLQNRFESEKQRNIYKKNNIRGFVDRHYEVKGGKCSDTIGMYDLITIDKNGNLIQKASFNKNREIINLYRYEYNDKNEKIKTYFIIHDRLLYKTDLYYDLSHKLIERIELSESGSVHSKQKYFYDSKDNPVKITGTGPSGSPKLKAVMQSNAEHGLVNAKFFMIKGGAEELNYELILKYDAGVVSQIQSNRFKPSASKSVQNLIYKGGLLSEIKQTDEDSEFIIKTEYLTFDQKTRNIERWLPIPDYSKYFKKDDETQKYKYKTPAYFPGGAEALKDYIQANLKYPKKAKKAGKDGLVVVGFVVDTQGNIRNIRIHKSVDYELDEAAIELVGNMPGWKPALNEAGKSTMSSFILPVNFVTE